MVWWHHRAVVDRDDLLTAVDSEFEVTGASLVGWPDPHDGRSPDDDEYSRVTNPARWLILGARADAWLVALERLGLATIERNVIVQWEDTPRTVISRLDRALPGAIGALPLVVGRSGLGDVVDAGVTLGVGDPAVCVMWVPYCGCDACDMGSHYELNQLDEHIAGVVSGLFRRLRSGQRMIQVTGDNGWSASGLRRRDNVDAILEDPSGWDELTGTTWLDLNTRR